MTDVGRHSSARSARIFGRGADLEAIESRLVAGGDVALVGPAGMGKTTVALEMLHRLARSGWLTALVPGAMTTTAADLAEILVSQLDRSQRAPGQSPEVVVERPSEGEDNSELRLGWALEGLVTLAEERGASAALVVDDLDALHAASRSAELSTLLARRLRTARRRSTTLSVLYVMRSDATLRDVFANPTAPLFAEVKTHRLQPLSAPACEELIKSRLHEAAGSLTEEALARLAISCRGMPQYLSLVANAAAVAKTGEEGAVVDGWDADKALAAAIDECGPATAERIESIRRSHRLGLEVARRLAVGDSPYAGEKTPNSVTRALKNLERLGLAHQPEAREWALTDPFLEEALRGLDARSVAALVSTSLAALPATPAATDRTVSRLRGNDVWGLRRRWFEPVTTILDSVHGQIKLTRLEHAIVATREFQRLRRMRQLGTVHLVYPAATHTRMEHSMGVLASSASVLETMIRSGAHSDISLWPTRAEEQPGWQEALTLARIGGLVHELATIPYGAALEAELESSLADPRARWERLWLAVVEDLMDAGLAKREADSLTHGHFCLNLRYVLEESGDRGEAEYTFVRDLLRGPLSADAFDSVARDRQAISFPSSSAGRLAATMKLVKAEPTWAGQRLAVGEVERREVGDELMMHFTALVRHRELVTGHRAVRAADAMIAAATHHWMAVLRDREDRGGGRARALAEERLLGCGDDGFVEYLVDFSNKQGESSEERQDTVSLAALRHLVEGLARRRLYRLAATAGGTRGVGEQLFAEFGDAERRRALEREAACAAGIDSPARILLAISRPPRRTFGEVLVSSEDGVLHLRDRHGKLASVVEDLDDLLLEQWSIDVFADPDLSAYQRRQAVDWLASRLRLRWEWILADDSSRHHAEE